MMPTTAVVSRILMVVSLLPFSSSSATCTACVFRPLRRSCARREGERCDADGDPGFIEPTPV